MWRVWRVVWRCCLFMVASYLLLATCHANQKPQVTVSIAPLQLLVKDIGAEHIDVVNLLPKNTDPHHFSLKPSQRKLLAQADLVVWVGMEEGLLKTMSSVAVDKQLRWSGLAEYEHAHHQHDEEHHEHEHLLDNHPWLDIEKLPLFTVVVAQYLGRLLPEHEELFQRRAQALNEELQVLAQQTKDKQTVLTRVVVDHNAYDALLPILNMEKLASIRGNGHRSPGARKLAGLHQLQDVGLLLSSDHNDDLVAQLSEVYSCDIAYLDILARGEYRSFVEYWQVLLRALRE